jgi:hypothetical protein
MPLDRAALVDLIRDEIFAVTPLPKIVGKVIKRHGIDLGENSDNTGKI